MKSTFKFTDAHREDLKRYLPYFESLRRNGAVRMSSVAVDRLAVIYNESTGQKMNRGCSACILDAVKLLFRNYDQQKDEELKRTNTDQTDIRRSSPARHDEPPADKPLSAEPISKGKGLPNARTNGRKDKRIL